MEINKQHNYLFHNDPEVITAIWCIDSETSREYLINLQTSEIIAERVNGKIIDPKRNIT